MNAFDKIPAEIRREASRAYHAEQERKERLYSAASIKTSREPLVFSERLIQEPPGVYAPPDEPAAPEKAHMERFKLVPFSQIAPSVGANYLVKGFLPRSGMAVVWGPPKCGKSFFVFDLMMHVALGWISAAIA